jgi:hypothetical protein
MNKYLLLIVLSALLFSCKGKKTSLAGTDDGEVTIPDFLEFFQPLKIPYQVTDTILRRKEAETAGINYKLFTRLVPDSILTHYFGKETRPHLYSIGKIKVPKAETYLFVKGVSRDRKILYILCFDKDDHFSAARPVIYFDNEPGVSGQAGLDAKYTLSVGHQRKAPDGQVFYRKDDYVFNADGGFVLILTESNESKTKIPPIYNPIDTLPRKHKFSRDYAQDKRNLIAIRDGKEPSRFFFFVHFEKDNGECKGELKGEAKFVSPGIARYRSYSDPCAVEFTFDAGGVSMKEQGGCGVHRDIKCFFEGYFGRHRNTRSKPVGKRPDRETS